MTLYRVGTSQGPVPRRWGRRARWWADRFACRVQGHTWGAWRIDDYDGPGLQVGEDPEDWMPWCSRESRDGEYGDRRCERCRAGEQRWPLGQDAPSRLPVRER